LSKIEDKGDTSESFAKSKIPRVRKSRSLWKLKGLRLKAMSSIDPSLTASALSHESVPEDPVSPPPSEVESTISARHEDPFSPPIPPMTPLSNRALAGSISRKGTPGTLVMYKAESQLSYVEENWI
jgi:hypothetical protein